jgi:hypothetical protein
MIGDRMNRLIGDGSAADDRMIDAVPSDEQRFGHRRDSLPRPPDHPIVRHTIVR